MDHKIYNADISEFQKIMKFITTSISKYNLLTNEKNNLILVIEEAVINVINHSYPTGVGKIEIEYYEDEEKITFIIKNNGIKFNPLAYNCEKHKEQDIHKRKVGGIGIHFIKSLSDSLDYKYKDSVNILRITKYLSNLEN